MLVRADVEPAEAELQQIAAHFDNCLRCHEAEEPVDRLVALYRAYSSPPLPPQLEQRLLDMVCGRFAAVDTKGQQMTTPTKQHYGFGITLRLPIEQALAEVTAALKEEGFGVLTTIDVQQTMKQKLDVEFEPYYILGACNPRLAHRALETVHDMGLLLPCNVIVHQHGRQTRVEVADPIAMLGIVQNDELQEIAVEAHERLQRVVERLGGAQ